MVLGLGLSSENPRRARAKMIGAVVILLPSLCSAFSASGGASIRPASMQPACLRIRGGSSAKPSAAKAGAGKGGPAAGGLKEEQLKRMLGEKFMIDLSVESDRLKLSTMVRDHQKGGGDFNMVKKDGEDYAIPGVEVEEPSETSSHFDGMTGKSAKTSGAAAAPKSAASAAQNAIKDKLQYKGLKYTAEDFSKMTRSEAEYRRQLMAMSKEEMKMDMPGGDIVSGLVGMFGGMFGKKSAEEGGELSDEDAIRAIEGKLPSKGVVNFRFKARQLKTTSGKMGGGGGPGSGSMGAVAAARAQAMKQKSSGDEVVAEEEQEPLSVRLQRWMSPRFIMMTAVSTGWRVASTVVTIVGKIIKGILGRSSKSEMKRIRRQQAANLSS